jgi:cytochrome c biogenesis protein CcmG, thiol:disulfide interchange protein DsbE
MKSFLSFSESRGVKRLCLIIWLLLGWTWAASAEQMKLDSLQVGGRTYRNVTVLGFNTTDVYFTHDGGMSNVKLRYLDPKLQKRFDYDPAAAAEAEKQQAAADAQYNTSVAANMAAQAQQVALSAQKATAATQDSLADPVSSHSLLGKPAPAIKGEKWLGEKPALSDKLVLVAFWAPWSIPCRKYLPELDRLQKKFAGKLAVVGVSAESEAEIANMTEPKIEFAFVLDPKGELRAAVGVTSIPYVMLVDPKGVVRYQGHPAAITEKYVESMLPQAPE